MARYEAALLHPAPADAIADALYDETVVAEVPWTQGKGVELLSFETDLPAVIALIDALPEDLPERSHHLAVKRATDGDLVIIELSELAAAEADCRRRRVAAPSCTLFCTICFATDPRRPWLAAKRGEGETAEGRAGVGTGGRGRGLPRRRARHSVCVS